MHMALGRAYRRGPSRSRPLVRLHRPLPCHTMPLGQGTFGAWHVLLSASMVDLVTGLRYAECSRAPDYVNVGFLGRWGTYACPQYLPSDIVPI